MKKINLQTNLIIGIILIAAFSRLIPHPPNFSPFIALGVFGGAHFSKKIHALIIPIFAIWLSDLFINNYIYNDIFNEFTFFYKGFAFQYIPFLLIPLFSIFVFKNGISLKNTIFSSFSSTLIFFFLSNFGVWISGTMYSKTISGLISCYSAAIPFLQNSIAGNVFYTSILFGGYYFLQKEFSILRVGAIKYI